MPRLVWRRSARVDLEAIFQHIASDNPRAAGAHIAGIQRRCHVLADQPRLGRDRGDLAPGLRMFAIGGQAVVAYRIRQDTVLILRVFTAGQDFETALGQDRNPDAP